MQCLFFTNFFCPNVQARFPETGHTYFLTYITYLGVEVVREVLCTCGVMPEVASQVKEYHVVHGKVLDVVVM